METLKSAVMVAAMMLMTIGPLGADCVDGFGMQVDETPIANAPMVMSAPVAVNSQDCANCYGFTAGPQVYAAAAVSTVQVPVTRYATVADTVTVTELQPVQRQVQVQRQVPVTTYETRQVASPVMMYAQPLFGSRVFGNARERRCRRAQRRAARLCGG